MARYVFAVRFRLDPASGVRVEPATFETTLESEADPPGEDGWLFFRDNLWRGEANAPDHLRGLAEEALGVPVENVEYRRFETSEAEYEALKGAIADDLSQFNADSVSEVLNKYFASSIEVGRGAER
ncbi:LWR-salt protein [Halalkalicoccus tibetensis]|uniref:LWR-salt protein n=1 Tax=Halalkalicoccus tibetensis TaxID=175632 RepID=A0ABD5UXR8_9EURY